MENWDFDHTSSVTESTGKIFGNRGRGFGALSSTYKHNYQPKIGGNYSNGNEKSTNRFNKVEQIDGQDRWKEISKKNELSHKFVFDKYD